MKKTHQLVDIVLEVGKKYKANKYKGYIRIDYLGVNHFVYTTGGDGKEPIENICDYAHAYNVWNLKPYTEPKIKVAKYAYFSIDKWFESNCFFKSDEEFKHRYGAYSKFIRLTNTEIEVDEY